MDQILEAMTEVIYNQRMRSMFPGFDQKVPVNPRLGMGHFLQYSELPEEQKVKERSVGQAALDKIRELQKKEYPEKINNLGSQRDPNDITNQELINVAYFSSNTLVSILGERLAELQAQIDTLKPVYDLSVKYVNDIDGLIAVYDVLPDWQLFTVNKSTHYIPIDAKSAINIACGLQGIKNLLGKTVNFTQWSSVLFVYKITKLKTGDIVISGVSCPEKPIDIKLDY